MDFSGLSQSQMEVILGPDLMQLETLITQLLSSSEEKRTEVDSSINSLGLKLADLLASSNSHDIDFREKCAVILRKLFTDKRIWGNLSVLTRCSLKSILLNCIRLEESEPIMTTLCRTVSELANSRHKWPELLPFLNECVSSNSSKLIESFFLIYGWCEGYVCRPLSPGIIISHSVFVNTLNVTLSLGVRIAILASAYRFTYYLPTSNERLPFQNLLPAMLTTLTDALTNGEEDFAREVLRIFIAWAELNPKFFRMQLAVVVGSIIDIAEDKSLEDLTRNSAVKFLLSLVQAREKAPGMMKRLPQFTNTCFAILLNLLLDIKDEPSWHSAETTHEKAGETNNYKFGKLYLSRFSDALGGKTVAPIAIEQLSAYLVAPEWDKRHAALVALAQIAKGSSEVMIKHLEQLVNMALHSFQDPHPRVRWAAIRSIGWLSIDFCPYLQDHCHNLVLHALSAAMDDFQNPRVQAQAALAVNNFCYSEKPETLVPYLDGILSKLLVLLQNDNHLVKAAALKALGAVAELSTENFREYYDLVMPYLKTMLVNANAKSNRLLRVQALECISFVAMVVGKERFRGDLKQVMEVLISLQKSLVEEFYTTVYILKASCKICKCMGKEFLPYMSTVMLPLVKCAQVELDETVSFDDSIHKVKFGYEIICASGRDLLLAKRSACHSHGLFAEILKEDYYPWISQAASILVPLLKFYSYVHVRISAINGKRIS